MAKPIILDSFQFIKQRARHSEIYAQLRELIARHYKGASFGSSLLHSATFATIINEIRQVRIGLLDITKHHAIAISDLKTTFFK